MDPEMDSAAKRQAEMRGVKSVMAVGMQAHRGSIEDLEGLHSGPSNLRRSPA
jgi:hypothetical protein